MNQPRVAGVLLIMYLLNLFAVAFNPIVINGTVSVVLTIIFTNMVMVFGFLAGDSVYEAHLTKRERQFNRQSEEI